MIYAIPACLYVTLTVLLLSSIHPTTSALALTGKDLIEKMSAKELNAYLSASVEMAAFMAHTRGDKQRSHCIVNWYFKTDGTLEKVMAALKKFGEKAPQPVLYVLMNRACGT